MANTYPVLTLGDAPEIVVEIAHSGYIGGVEEIGAPGIAAGRARHWAASQPSPD
jgi:hypothetical protein